MICGLIRFSSCSGTSHKGYEVNKGYTPAWGEGGGGTREHLLL